MSLLGHLFLNLFHFVSPFFLLHVIWFLAARCTHVNQSPPCRGWAAANGRVLLVGGCSVAMVRWGTCSRENNLKTPDAAKLSWTCSQLNPKRNNPPDFTQTSLTQLLLTWQLNSSNHADFQAHWLDHRWLNQLHRLAAILQARLCCPACS